MMNALSLQKKYNLNPLELACVAIFLQINDKTFAWSYTLGKDNKSIHKSTLAVQWFRQERVQRFLFDHNEEKEDKAKVDIKSSDVKKANVDELKKEVEKTFGIITDITGDNVKELFINELNCCTDSIKRAELLLKVTNTLDLILPDKEELSLPTIYLPSRCKECTYLKK